MDQLETKLWETISANALLGVSEVRPEMQLGELGINSLNYLRIIVTLEDEFDVGFSDEDLSFERIRTLGDLAELIRTKLQK